MIDILSVATWAGALMSIIALVAFFVRPIIRSFTKITDNLTKMSHSLDMINRDLEASKTDRTALHAELLRHDERLDAHSKKLVSHEEQLRILFANKEKWREIIRQKLQSFKMGCDNLSTSFWNAVRYYRNHSKLGLYTTSTCYSDRHHNIFRHITGCFYLQLQKRRVDRTVNHRCWYKPNTF